MDSLTQIVLGASVGELVAGKKLGNKAVFWGAVAGTIPDLDVMFNPLVSETARLSIHRGFSHSFAFAFLFAPLFGYLLWKIYKKSEANFWDWTSLFFWGIITHFMLDSFTNYGTQIFNPFSDFRVSWNTIFVIDPFYTLPFLGLVVALMFFKKGSTRRLRLNYFALGISSFYLMFTVVNKQYINSVFESAAKSNNIEYSRYMSAPTPFNNFLWRGLFEAEDGYYETYYSWFDDTANLEFTYIPTNRHKLAGLEDTEPVKKLKWFSNGYYSITSDEENLYFNDIRFGTIGGWNNSNANYVFSFKLIRGENLSIARSFDGMKLNSKLIHDFLYRIIGQKVNSYGEITEERHDSSKRD
ncbi:MAG: membrane protein [Melioribacteraceae bacterium]|nr:MAG: membrane protein [Melioribacteraceae bacterium]